MMKSVVINIKIKTLTFFSNFSGLRSIQESTTLAGYFQNIVDDCKVSPTIATHFLLQFNRIFQCLHPAIDEFIAKSSKLENQIRSTIFAFSAFIESLQKIAHNASNTKGK